MKNAILKLTAGMALGLACFTLTVDQSTPTTLDLGVENAMALPIPEIPFPILCLNHQYFKTSCAALGLGCNAVTCEDLENPQIY